MTSATRYHHGDLPNALRRAAAEVIAERGLGSFSLREVARRAGVSHTAPAHHFGDVRGLLTAIATEGFDTLYESTSRAAREHTDPVERLQAIGEAYVELARSHPAHCEVMFRDDVVHRDDQALVTCGLGAYGVLEDAVKAIIETERLSADLDDMAWMCWSTMQGLVTLETNIARINELKGGAPVATAELIRRFTDMIVAGARATGRRVTGDSCGEGG